MEWEAQDEGFLAKILLQEGSKDVPVGTPVAVVVEDQENVRRPHHQHKRFRLLGHFLFETYFKSVISVLVLHGGPAPKSLHSATWVSAKLAEICCRFSMPSSTCK